MLKASEKFRLYDVAMWSKNASPQASEYTVAALSFGDAVQVISEQYGHAGGEITSAVVRDETLHFVIEFGEPE